MQEAVSLLNNPLSPHVMCDNVNMCSIQESVTLNVLQTYEQTAICSGQQLACNNTVSVLASSHTPGGKYFGNKFCAQWAHRSRSCGHCGVRT